MLDSESRLREAPQTLPPEKIAGIEQQYQGSLLHLQERLDQERPIFTAATEAITKKYSQQKRSLEAQLKSEEIAVRQKISTIEIKFEVRRVTVSHKEREARMKSESSIVECKNKFSNLTTQAVSEAERLQTNYTSELDSTNQELAASAKHVREICWRRDQVLRTRTAYGAFTFRRYCVRVLGGRG